MKIEQILKWYLRIASLYLIGDGLFHLFDFKLIDAGNWSLPSLVYAQFIGDLYGSFAILAGILGIEGSRDLNKYRNFLSIAAIWSVFYGTYLLYSALTTDFVNIFVDSPSIYVWMSFYNSYLIFEAELLFILSLLVYLFKKHSK